MAQKRKLPVISNAPAPAEDEETRPPWHWVVLGVVLTFAAWLPLAWIATVATRELVLPRFGINTSDGTAAAQAMANMSTADSARLAFANFLPQAVCAGLAAFGGGFVIARFGAGVGARQTLTLGATVAAIAALTTLRQGGGFLIVLPMAMLLFVPATWLGGRVGAKKPA